MEHMIIIVDSYSMRKPSTMVPVAREKSPMATGEVWARLAKPMPLMFYN